METTGVVLQSEHIKIQQWPHSRPDCPSLWNGSSNPCDQCYCYVCDVPVGRCDDISLHAAADGRTPDWAQTKRRRRALAQTWLDIPDLVDLLVSFSVDESQLCIKQNTRASFEVRSPTSISPEDKDFVTEKVAKKLDFEGENSGGDLYAGTEIDDAAAGVDDLLLHSLSKVKIELESDKTGNFE
ncbi:unnamed protein product [Agarophyton chilense]